MNISDSLFNSIEGTGTEYGPFKLWMLSQLMIHLWRDRNQRRRIVKHTLGRSLVRPMAIQSPIVGAKTVMAIGSGRVAVAGHVDGGQGVVRAAVGGWGPAGVMW